MKPLICFVLLTIVGCARIPQSNAVKPQPPATDLDLLSGVRNGMSSDSLDIITGEPQLIVDGVPFLQSVHQGQNVTYSVNRRDYSRYETWFFRPSRVDTIHSIKAVTLYGTSEDMDSEPQANHEAHLEYSFAIVIDRTIHRVVQRGFLPRGFLDATNDIQLGAVVSPLQ